MLKQINSTVLFIGMFMLPLLVHGQSDTTEAALEKLRTQSGVDPTRVSSRMGYSFLYYDQSDDKSQINNRISMNIGVNRWSFSLKPEFGTIQSGVPGEGFKTGFNDLKFSVLNAFYVKGKHALAGSVEFGLPTGTVGFSTQYFTATPAITYSHTIKPSLIFAIQPQYTFALAKDPLYPDISVITIRSFIANFNTSGWFFVFEPRPIIDLENDEFDLILSPIVGKSLGAGFNLIFLSEIPTKQETIDSRGILYQFGFNKNF